MIKTIELFSGVGAQRMALRNINIPHEVVGVCEIDKYAHKSYEAIHGSTLNFGDITKVERLPSVDLWTYSFPCTDLSLAGNQSGLTRGSGTRSGLLWEVERLLNISEKPKYLLLENVKQLVGKKFKAQFDEWCSILEQMGYKNYWKVLNAKSFGVPQNRERVFMVSVLGDEGFNFPKPVELIKTIKDVLDQSVPEKYTLSDAALLGLINHRDRNKALGRGFGFKIKQDSDIAFCIMTSPSGASSNFISVNSNSSKIRRLTPLECWRLMGFLDTDFNKANEVNSEVQLYKQAGNSIVVPVLEGIFRSMFCEDKGNLDIKPTTDLF